MMAAGSPCQPLKIIRICKGTFQRKVIIFVKNEIPSIKGISTLIKMAKMTKTLFRKLQINKNNESSSGSCMQHQIGNLVI
jgi:hypothetical protein